MIREALDEKYSYQIDEHGMVHLFRGEEDCQQYLTNPLLSAIFKIEALKKENEDLKEQVEQMKCCGKQLFGENGKLDGYMSAKAWHYVTDKLPPNPKESEDGRHIKPLNYICAYDCGDGDYECGEFMYLGNGIWLGENKDYYPIYAWMDCAVEVPLPPRKGNK